MMLTSIFEILYLPEIVSTEQGVSAAVAKLAMTKILPITLSLALVKAVWDYFRENKHMGIEIDELARIFLLSLFLFAFNPAINLFNDMVNGIAAEYEYTNVELKEEVVINQVMSRAKALMPNLSGKKMTALKNSLTGRPKEDAKILAETKMEYDAENGEGESSWSMMDVGTAVKRMVGQISNIANNWFMAGVTGVVSKGGTMLAQSVMWVVIIIFTMILRCLGPLAIAMTLIFKNQTKTWFMTFAAAKCAIITTMIVESIGAGMVLAFHSDAVMSIMGLDAIDDTSPLAHMVNGNLILGMNLTLILCYVLVFFFTSKWIGSGDGSQVLSQAAGLAMMGTSAGFKAIQSAAKKIGSGSGNNSGHSGGSSNESPAKG
ncbi:MAG: hypothetical protein ABJF11_20280 [Reichenbachiella sp.]|uniref:hypothetical protein n=1 Tax=Reichenbachiella sp. TaxID=2184521 RepID=UPI003263C229